jgi:hypothetical protein
MPVILVHEGPTLTRERYEAAVRRVMGSAGPLRTPSDWPVDGLLVHGAGQGATGFRVVDVWESEEAFQAFGEKLLPAIAASGVAVDPPQIFPVHNFVRT